MQYLLDHALKENFPYVTADGKTHYVDLGDRCWKQAIHNDGVNDAILDLWGYKGVEISPQIAQIMACIGGQKDTA